MAVVSAGGAQSVTVGWHRSFETNVVGYRLHYGSIACQVDTCRYERSVFISVPFTNYTVTDINFSPGATTYFVVTAMTADGLEGRRSAVYAYTAPSTSGAVAGLFANLTEVIVVNPAPDSDPAGQLARNETHVAVNDEPHPRELGPRLSIWPMGQPADAVLVGFQSPISKYCELQACDDNGTWSTLFGFTTEPTSEWLEYYEPLGPGTRRFFRLVVWNSVD